MENELVIEFFQEVASCMAINNNITGAISELRINSFDKLYKGSQYIPFNDNLRYSIGKGYLMLRPFERVSISTGIIIKHIPKGAILRVKPNSERTLSHGNIILDIPTYNEGFTGAIELIIYNSCNFLNRLEVGQLLGELQGTPGITFNFTSI